METRKFYGDHMSTELRLVNGTVLSTNFANQKEQSWGYGYLPVQTVCLREVALDHSQVCYAVGNGLLEFQTCILQRVEHLGIYEVRSIEKCYELKFESWVGDYTEMVYQESKYFRDQLIWPISHGKLGCAFPIDTALIQVFGRFDAVQPCVVSYFHIANHGLRRPLPKSRIWRVDARPFDSFRVPIVKKGRLNFLLFLDPLAIYHWPWVVHAFPLSAMIASYIGIRPL
ncbi:hypothetical protein CUMW_118130 [Citrus unshiu]|nr:hypothetical protein CUMW_118130 [Citrus unshiu]